MIRIALVVLSVALFALAACNGDDGGGASQTPTATPDVASLPILDPWEVHVAASDGGGDKTVFFAGTGSLYYALSPDGDEIAVAESTYMSTTLRFLSLDGIERAHVTQDGSAGELTWSPDGKYVVSKFYKSGADSIVAIPSSGGTPKIPLAPAPSATHPTSIFPSGWLPGGELLVEQSVAPAKTELLAINVSTGASRKLADLNVWGDFFGVPQLSPDKTRLAVWVSAGPVNDPACSGLTASTSIWTIDLASGATSRLTPESYCGSGGMVWSPDGTQLAFSVLLGRDSSYLYTVDVASGQTRLLTTGLNTVTAWNSVGQILAEKVSCVNCEGGGDPVAVKIDPATGAQQELAGPAPNAVSPSGDTVAVADGGVRRIDLSGQLVAGLAPAADGWRYASLLWSSDQKHVAYVRFHKQGTRFFEVNRDGSNFETKLFFDQVPVGSPLGVQMSPDGKHIAYWVSPGDKTAGKTADLYIADADGSGAQRVDVAGSVGLFAWSPDSSRILFVAVDTTKPSGGGTFVVNAGGGGLRQVTTEVGYDKSGGYLLWAPNSGLVVFPGAPMRVVDVDTGQVTNVEPGTEKGIPTWSSDSKKLLYPVFNTQDGSDILVSAIDGSGTTTIHGDNRSLGGLTVSPDGTKLAYELASGDTGGLFVSNIDGTDAKLVLEGASLAAGGALWSPDGKWLAAVAAPNGGEGGVFVLRPDGSEARQLSRGTTVAGIAWASNDRLRLLTFMGGL